MWSVTFYLCALRTDNVYPVSFNTVIWFSRICVTKTVPRSSMFQLGGCGQVMARPAASVWPGHWSIIPRSILPGLLSHVELSNQISIRQMPKSRDQVGFYQFACCKETTLHISVACGACPSLFFSPPNFSSTRQLSDLTVGSAIINIPCR